VGIAEEVADWVQGDGGAGEAVWPTGDSCGS
jgi:hypothetical protein